MVELHVLHNYTMIWEKEVLVSPPPSALSPSLSLPLADALCSTCNCSQKEG